MMRIERGFDQARRVNYFWGGAYVTFVISSTGAIDVENMDASSIKSIKCILYNDRDSSLIFHNRNHPIIFIYHSTLNKKILQEYRKSCKEQHKIFAKCHSNSLLEFKKTTLRFSTAYTGPWKNSDNFCM